MLTLKYYNLGLDTPVYVNSLTKKLNLVVALILKLLFNLIKLNPSSAEGERYGVKF